MSVSTYLSKIASEALLSDTENASIQRSLSTLKERLNLYFGNQLSGHYQFGSFDRQTILPRKMDENSDVDYLVLFSDGSYQPQTYLDKLNRFATAKYSTSEVAQSHPTIQLELSHIRFELVPATVDWWGATRIPSKQDGYQTWITTNPKDFSSSLLVKNGQHKYQIKPLVRLVKYWNAENGYPFESFELEKSIVSKEYGFWGDGYTDLKGYFFDFMVGLSAWSLPQWKQDKISRAKKIIEETKKLEREGYPILAEMEIKKLIPTMATSTMLPSLLR